MQLDNLIEDSLKSEANTVELDALKQDEIITFIESHNTLQKYHILNTWRNKIKNFVSNLHLIEALGIAMTAVIIICIPIGINHFNKPRPAVVSNDTITNKPHGDISDNPSQSVTSSDNGADNTPQNTASSDAGIPNSTNNTNTSDNNTNTPKKPNDISDSLNNGVSYKLYTNSVRGFSIDCPTIFQTSGGEYYNNAYWLIISPSYTGINFMVVDKNNSPYQSADTLYNNIESSLKNVIYKTHSATSYEYAYVYTDFDGLNCVYYEKSIVGNGSICTLTFAFPEKERNYYEPLAKHIVASFKAPNVNNKFEMPTTPSNGTNPPSQPNTPNNQVSYNLYTSKTRGYSLDYPTSYSSPLGEEFFNDAYWFIMSGWGGVNKFTIDDKHNYPYETAETSYNNNVLTLKNVFYKKLTDTGYEFAYIDDSNYICYKKSIVGSGSICTVTFSFSQYDRNQYEPIAKHVLDSFKAPNVNNKFEPPAATNTATAEAGTGNSSN